MSEETAIWTIGHSTTEIDAFIAALESYGITSIADIRSYPGSRHSPQFGKAAFEASLEQAGIAYEHVPDLGGRRGSQDVDEHLNAAWRNRSFRNYADYTQSESFEEGLAHLVERAAASKTAYLCSEAVPWRCHRTIVSDVLMSRGHLITHLVGGRTMPHVLGGWGPEPRYVDGKVIYPDESGD